MQMANFCIVRPVFTLVLNLIIVLAGYIGYTRLELRNLPKIDQPIVSITTTYPGASPEVVEEQITNRIENALAGLSGMDTLVSKSAEGNSTVTVQFKAGDDLETGVNDIRDKLAGIGRLLPDNAEEPTIVKADSSAQASVFIAFTDNKRSTMALTAYIDDYLKPQIEKIDGVASVAVWGSRRFALRVSIIPWRMSATKISLADIENALTQANSVAAGGVVEGNTRDYALIPKTQLQSIAEFEQIVLKHDGDFFVRLGDVAKLDIRPAEDRVVVHANGEQALVAAVTPKNTANPVSVSRAVIQFIAAQHLSLPKSMQMRVVYDRSIFINASIHNVYETLIEAIVLVIIVVFAFLGSWRATFIPLTTIPICIIGVFFLLYWVGYSINNMTLLALVLGIGLVVDDAIVMLENIHHHIERGHAPIDAAKRATSDIGFAICAMTLTLVAVYTPLGFIQGITGMVFREFAFCLAGAVLISGLVALTLTPMLSAQLLPEQNNLQNQYAIWLNNTMQRVCASYARLLRIILPSRWRFFAVLIMLIILGVYLLAQMPRELAPTEDASTVLTFVKAPSGASKHTMIEQMHHVETVLRDVPEMSSYVAASSVPSNNQGIAFLALKPWSLRTRNQAEIINALRPKLMAIPGVLAFPIAIPTLPTSGSHALEFVIQYPGSYQDLSVMLNAFRQAIAEEPRIIQVNADFNLASQQIAVIIDHETAADLGIPITDIVDALSTLFGGKKVSSFSVGTSSYDIQLKLPESSSMKTDYLLDIIALRNPRGDMIPLRALVTLVPKLGAETLAHYDRLRSVTITASVSQGYSLGEAQQFFEQAAARTLPDEARFSWSGQTRDFIRSANTMLITACFALIFIYLVLSAQFESFRDPLIVMLTVPFSMLGAVLALWCIGGTNNLYTQIGFITLIGLITKHGILIVSQANAKKLSGHDTENAIVSAAQERLRPILMTTAAMVLGALPLAFATGAGAYARAQLGWVIVGGMLVGTLFSLFVVPLTYYLVTRR